MLKDLEEKIKIERRRGSSHVEHQFLPEQRSGSFFIPKISAGYLS
jgi:hypothetical protein